MVTVKITGISRLTLIGQGEQSLVRGLETAVSHKNRRRNLLRTIVEQPCCLDEKVVTVDTVQLIREDRER
jgi:hypothetical protein